MTAAPPGDPGGARVEMHAESRDSSTFTQIGTQINQAPPLPEQAFGPWAELAAPPGLANLPARPGLFVGRARELARLDAALAAELRRVLDQVLTPALTPAEQARVGTIIMTGSSHDSSTFTQIGTQTNYNRP